MRFLLLLTLLLKFSAFHFCAFYDRTSISISYHFRVHLLFEKKIYIREYMRGFFPSPKGAYHNTFGIFLRVQEQGNWYMLLRLWTVFSNDFSIIFISSLTFWDILSESLSMCDFHLWQSNLLRDNKIFSIISTPLFYAQSFHEFSMEFEMKNFQTDLFLPRMYNLNVYRGVTCNFIQ